MLDPSTISSLRDYRLLGRSGLRVSPLALGGGVFGDEWGWGAAKAESRRIFDAYIERGGNFIDTSNVYNNQTSETLLGDFMRAKRDRIVVSTKYSNSLDTSDPNSGGNHRKSLIRAVEGSLERLQTDYIDVYMIHAWEYRTPIDEVLRAQDDLVRQGKILYLGISNAPAWVIARGQCLAAQYGWSPFINLQTEYSLIERSAEAELIPMAMELGLGLCPWSPTGGGLLTGKYSREDMAPVTFRPGAIPARKDFVRMRLDERSLAIAEAVQAIAAEKGCRPVHVALRWLLERPWVCSPIVGCHSEAQLLENLECLNISLSVEEIKKLSDVSRPPRIVPYNTINGAAVPKMIAGDWSIESHSVFNEV